MMPKILITGAGGFIGSSLINQWTNKHAVIGVTRKQLDLLDTNAVKTFFEEHTAIELIIHCAAVGGSRLSNYDIGRTDVVENNLRMFFNVTRCIKPCQRLIYLGSGAEYDRDYYQPKMPEEYFDSYVPTDAYGFSKYAIAKYLAQHENMLNLRIFGLYGPGENYRYKFISNAIVKALLGLPITIAQNVMFDYLYIKDFADLVERLFSSKWPYRHMNITPVQSIDLFSIAGIVNEETGNKAGITVLNPGWNTEYSGDNRRLLEVIGPFAFTPYQKGISALTDYYHSIWDSLDLDTVRDDPYLEKCIVRR